MKLIDRQFNQAIMTINDAWTYLPWLNMRDAMWRLRAELDVNYAIDCVADKFWEEWKEKFW